MAMDYYIKDKKIKRQEKTKRQKTMLFLGPKNWNN